jgi:MFS family permease
VLSVLFVRDSRGHAEVESRQLPGTGATPTLSFRQVFSLVSWKDRALFSSSQAGLVNNLNDGMAWGLFPLYFAAAGLAVEQVGLLAAIYPGVWGLAQLGTGALSDRLGRKGMIVGGMWMQAAGIMLVLLGTDFPAWALAMGLLGLGTALVYPTLLAAISDVAHPEWRAAAVGVYRLWRDGGYAIGALIAGVVADLLGVPWAIAGIAALTFASGLVVLARMYETLPRKRLGNVVVERSQTAAPASGRTR